jgi:Ohr subfamily peroxiredoxin
VSSVDRLGPEDLYAAGRKACHLGVSQLLDRVIRGSAEEPKATPIGAEVDDVHPEDLLATGYAACFWGALMFVSAQSSTTAPEGSLVTADVIQTGPRTRPTGLDVALCVSLPGLDRRTAAALVRRAHEICPYTHVSRSSIDVRLAA